MRFFFPQKEFLCKFLLVNMVQHDFRDQNSVFNLQKALHFYVNDSVVRGLFRIFTSTLSETIINVFSISKSDDSNKDPRDIFDFKRFGRN